MVGSIVTYDNSSASSSYWTSTGTVVLSGNIPGSYYGWAPTIASPEPKPESALEWLDRRVDEIRVQL